MPQTKTYTQTTYEFSELDADAQARAIEQFSEWAGQDFDHFDAPHVWETFNDEHLKPFGIEDADHSYRGFWSQGDGASFTGRIDLGTWIRKTGNYNRYRKLYNAVTRGLENVEIEAYIQRNSHHYCHEYTVEAVIDIHDWAFGHASEGIVEQVNECEAELTEWVRRKSRELYKALEDAYWWRVSEETTREWLENSDYEFDRLGNYPPQVFDAADDDEAA